jgi:hypothetical protein
MEILEWTARSPRNLIKALAAVLVVWVFGFVLLFGIPKWATDAAIQAAQESIGNFSGQYVRTGARHEAESGWYRHEYTVEIPGYLERGNALKSEAEEALQQALAAEWPDERISLAVKADLRAKLAIGELEKAEQKLNQNSQLRADVRRNLASQRVSDTTADILSSLSARFANEAKPMHLLKHTDPVGANLAAIEKTFAEKSALIDQVQMLLPDDSSSAGNGDPTLAQEKLDAAKMLIDSINTLAVKVTGQLDYLAEALQNAAPFTSKARSDYESAVQHVAQIKAATGYWLKTPTANVEQASLFLTTAESTLNSPSEGERTDYPAAYEAAKTSIDLSASGRNGADEEGAAADETAALISGFGNKHDVAQAKLDNGSTAYDSLNAYHANGAWSEVSSNKSTAERLMASATEDIRSAEQLSDSGTQLFLEARQKALNAYASLDKVAVLVSGLEATRDNLENHRQQWPASESRAESMINAQTSDINSYGGYDSSARNDYNSAVSLLSEARSDAQGRYYVPAVEKANSAYSLADGTGDSAHSAYRAHVAAEEARKRAEEEAAERRRQQESSSPSYGGSDWGSGGSSSGGSDFGGSDFGGGGSDSGFGGGGSDSDW